jgi:hypothetical protein
LYQGPGEPVRETIEFREGDPRPVRDQATVLARLLAPYTQQVGQDLWVGEKGVLVLRARRGQTANSLYHGRFLRKQVQALLNV